MLAEKFGLPSMVVLNTLLGEAEQIYTTVGTFLSASSVKHKSTPQNRVKDTIELLI
jgi:hypothetical protein